MSTNCKLTEKVSSGTIVRNFEFKENFLKHKP